MIVRILTEGQYNLPGQFVDKLNEVDNQIVAVVEVNDETNLKGELACAGGACEVV